MRQEIMGETINNETISKYTLSNKAGLKMVVTDLGGILTELHVPTRAGKTVDVVLGYDTIKDYEEGTFFLGAPVGRSANRIQGASVVLDGTTYHLTANENNNNLHSGNDYYHLRPYQVEDVGEDFITFSLQSPHLDQGYPGNLSLRMTYYLRENGIEIAYEGISDRKTLFNMTNHSYFNLNGEGSGPITHHQLWMNSSYYTPIDRESIPTGQIAHVEGTPFDFRKEKEIGQDIDSHHEQIQLGQGYDHNFVIDREKTKGLNQAATLFGDASKLTMEVWTDLPGIQLYTGNFLKEVRGKQGHMYSRRGGVCFETQYYPDAVHHDNFPSPIIKAGEKRVTRTCYLFR